MAVSTIICAQNLPEIVQKDATNSEPGFATILRLTIANPKPEWLRGELKFTITNPDRQVAVRKFTPTDAPPPPVPPTDKSAEKPVKKPVEPTVVPPVEPTVVPPVEPTVVPPVEPTVVPPTGKTAEPPSVP
ncbi:MAG: hypothetical protein NTW28_36930 [Candidatus Solibacter sp.]|nr:hypothetical protein [Candidatus Solibacter sp.]